VLILVRNSNKNDCRLDGLIKEQTQIINFYHNVLNMNDAYRRNAKTCIKYKHIIPTCYLLNYICCIVLYNEVEVPIIYYKCFRRFIFCDDHYISVVVHCMLVPEYLLYIIACKVF